MKRELLCATAALALDIGVARAGQVTRADNGVQIGVGGPTITNSGGNTLVTAAKWQVGGIILSAGGQTIIAVSAPCLQNGTISCPGGGGSAPPSAALLGGNSGGSFTVVSPDGLTDCISSGTLQFCTGAVARALGYTPYNATNPASYVNAAGAAAAAPVQSVAALQGTITASALGTALSLGTAAFQPASAFDAAGVSATETTRAQAAEALLLPSTGGTFSGMHGDSLTLTGSLFGDISNATFVNSLVTTPTGVGAENFNLQYALNTISNAVTGSCNTAYCIVQNFQVTNLGNGVSINMIGADTHGVLESVQINAPLTLSAPSGVINLALQESSNNATSVVGLDPTLTTVSALDIGCWRNASAGQVGGNLGDCGPLSSLVTASGALSASTSAGTVTIICNTANASSAGCVTLTASGGLALAASGTYTSGDFIGASAFSKGVDSGYAATAAGSLLLTVTGLVAGDLIQYNGSNKGTDSGVAGASVLTTLTAGNAGLTIGGSGHSATVTLNTPTASVPGGVLSAAAVAHQVITSLGTNGVFTLAQLAVGDISGLVGTYATLLSPALTGFPTAPTQTLSDASTDIATDAFVRNQTIRLPHVNTWNDLSEQASSSKETLSTTAGLTVDFPVFVRDVSATVNKMAVDVATLNSGATLDIGLRANVSGQPGTLVVDAGSVALAAGVNTVTFTTAQTLATGIYFIEEKLDSVGATPPVIWAYIPGTNTQPLASTASKLIGANAVGPIATAPNNAYVSADTSTGTLLAAASTYTPLSSLTGTACVPLVAENISASTQ